MRRVISSLAQIGTQAVLLSTMVMACLAQDRAPDGPDAAYKESLMKEIDRAIQLIQDDKIEQLVEDYYPYETYRVVRKRSAIKNFAADLRLSKALLRQLQSRLVACRQATLSGNNDEVQFLPVIEEEGKVAKTGPEPLPELPQIDGYGSDFGAVLKKSISDLKAENYEEFLTRILPLRVLQTLTEQGTLEMAAEQYKTNPQLAKLMLADLEAIAKAPAKPAKDLIQLTLLGRNQFEAPREIRFQLSGGSWRFFDQATEIRTEQNLVIANAEVPRDSHAESILTFERIRDHWRLVELPYGVPRGRE